jgi:hypothetical protein
MCTRSSDQRGSQGITSVDDVDVAYSLEIYARGALAVAARMLRGCYRSDLWAKFDPIKIPRMALKIFCFIFDDL